MNQFRMVIRALRESYEYTPTTLEDIKREIQEDDADPEQYIWDVDPNTLEELYPEVYSPYFEYPELYRGVVYHQTTVENWNNIKSEGIKPMNNTRGITNRGTGSAIFTSYEPDPMNSYGEVLIKIDLDVAKTLNPDIETSLEDPVLESERRKLLAGDLGVDEHQFELSQSDGIRDTTLIVYGDIPIKAINREDN